MLLDRYTKRVEIPMKVGTWQGFLNAIGHAANLGEVLETLFRAWEKTLLALAALIGAVLLLRGSLRRLKGGPD